MKFRSLGTWILAAVLLLFLAWAILAAYWGWTGIGAGVETPLAGYAALVFGVVISLIVGVGLMALTFYSSRAGYDQPPKYDLRQEPTDAGEDNFDDSKHD